MIVILGLHTASAELRPVAPFDAIVNDSPLDLTVAIGDHQGVQIHGPMAITQRVSCEVKKGVLTVRVPKDLTWRPEEQPEVNITLPALRSVVVETDAALVLQGRVEAPVLEIAARGSGPVAFETLAGQTVTLTAAGTNKVGGQHITGDAVTLAAPGGAVLEALTVSGNTTATLVGRSSLTIRRYAGTKLDLLATNEASVWVTGVVPFLDLTASDRAQVELQGLQVERSTVTATDTARVHVVAAAELHVTASDQASVLWSGAGRAVSNVSGAASVQARRTAGP